MANFLKFHLKEIRNRGFYFFCCFFLTLICTWIEIIPILYLTTRPLKINQFVFTDLSEFWYSLFLLSLISSFFFIFPVLIYQFWCFFSPSLYHYERKKWTFFFLCSIFLYLTGNTIVFQIFLPFLIKFFLNSQINLDLLNVTYLANIFSYMRFLLSVFSLFSILSQFPVIFFLFSDFFSRDFMVSNRVYFGFLILLIASFLSPPDVLSQLFFSILFFFLYELCIFYLCLITDIKRK